MPRLAYWLTAALLAGLLLAKFEPNTGFTALLRFGNTLAEKRLPDLEAIPLATASGNGYDGQFYAQLAIDPTLRSPELDRALDAPAYRARRILAPAVAHVLGLGRPLWILQVYALLNVVCWGVLALLLYREIGAGDAISFARWFGCVFSLGVLESVRQSLVDLPALLLLLQAARIQTNGTAPKTTFWLAAGHLTKETNLLGSLALLATPKPSLRTLSLFTLAALPLLGWTAYVSSRFSGGGLGFGNFTWPFLGAIDQLRTSAAALLGGNFDSRHTLAWIAIPSLFLQATVLIRHRDTANPWWRIGIAYGLLLTVLGPWVWSGYWAACRAVLPLTVAFNLLLPVNRAFWPLWIGGNLTLLHGVWRFL